ALTTSRSRRRSITLLMTGRPSDSTSTALSARFGYRYRPAPACGHLERVGARSLDQARRLRQSPMQRPSESVRKPGLGMLLNVPTEMDTHVFLQLQCQATIDGQRLAGDEGRFIRAQEGDGAGDVAS